MTRPPFVIAVDGPAASGKGTIASGLARLYGYRALDTGLIYRAVGMAVSDLGDEAAPSSSLGWATRAARCACMFRAGDGPVTAWVLGVCAAAAAGARAAFAAGPRGELASCFC